MSRSEVQVSDTSQTPGFLEEARVFWRTIPDKGLFFVLLGAWVLLFHFLGNSTLGYEETTSLFGWLHYVYQNSPDDDHGYFIAFVVLGLMWWKRGELMRAPKRGWWPGLALLAAASGLHILGYMIQQTRVSVVAFFVGVYGLMGLVWGWAWLKSTFFPFFLFGFCVPLATLSESITFPLRLLVTQITGFISDVGLGIGVICDGTKIYDPARRFQYEVAAACSGIRSLTATFALAIIFGFVMFQSWWKRAVMIVSAFPLAVLGNVFRLTMIIIAAEAFGQEGGNYVHESSWLSLLPYLPALGGLFLLGHWMRDKESADEDAGQSGLMPRATQEV